MGPRELLILILILAVIGVILRGLYVVLSSRRGQLKIVLEKNVPVYDLEEIEFRELPNGGARVVERSFAHVMKQNSRFATPAKTAAAKYGRGASKTSAVGAGAAAMRSAQAAARSARLSSSAAGVSGAAGIAASGVIASTVVSGVSASQSVPMLTNAVSNSVHDSSSNDADLDLMAPVISSAVSSSPVLTTPSSASSVSASTAIASSVRTLSVLTSHTPAINSAKETPYMDDLISALENELDEELKANQAAQTSGQLAESLNDASLNQSGLNEEPDERFDDEVFSQKNLHQDNLDPDDDEGLDDQDDGEFDQDNLDPDELESESDELEGDELDDDDLNADELGPAEIDPEDLDANDLDPDEIELDDDELDEEFDEEFDKYDLDEQLDDQLEKLQDDDDDDDETETAFDWRVVDAHSDDETSDITYTEPELIEVELLGHQYGVEGAVKQPPVLDHIIEKRDTSQNSIDEDLMYRDPGDDEFDDDEFDDEEDIPEHDSDDDDEEQFADDEFGDEFQKMFPGDSLTDDDIFGDDMDDDSTDQDYRDDEAGESVSGGLMGWAGAKWAAVSAGLAAAADQRKAAAEEKQALLQRRQAEAEQRDRQRAQEKAEHKARAAQQRADEKAQRQFVQDHNRSDPVLNDSVLNDDDDLLFDDPFNELSAPREKPRTQQPQPQQKRQAQPSWEPRQQSLLNMEDEGAPLSSDSALYQDDAYSEHSREQVAPAAKAPKKTVKKQAPSREEPRTAQNNNIDPEYNEVLIINVMSRPDREFAGIDVLPALLSCGMRFGDMSIFHRHVDDRGTGPVLFSIANAVNPGTFDLNKINDFSTRGLCFFLTLPNVINNMQAFNKMLDVAQKIRSLLDGEIKDDNRSVMTAQTVEHYRQRIRDFELLQLRQSHKQSK